MDDIHKLHHMLEHWAEHNIEHAESYSGWADKAKAMGKAELSGVLAEIAEETKKMDVLFKRASGLCR
jgi:hypothetical protein